MQIEDDVCFEVTCSGEDRGVYLREAYQVSKDCKITIAVNPKFQQQQGLNNHAFESFNITSDLGVNRKYQSLLQVQLSTSGQNIKINFNMNLILSCSASWVTCPLYLTITNVKRFFDIRVQCTQLQPGVNVTMVITPAFSFKSSLRVMNRIILSLLSSIIFDLIFLVTLYLIFLRLYTILTQYFSIPLSIIPHPISHPIFHLPLLIFN